MQFELEFLQSSADLGVMNDMSLHGSPFEFRSHDDTSPIERIERLASGNAVAVFSISSCCMCHVVKRLLFSLGVSPMIYELDEESDGIEIEEALSRLVGGSVLPTVFIGGKLIGGLEQVMAAHISGSLVPRLKEAGALWL
ncbi:hypothetical protein O6H91_22G057400 [Diphasiastrum complanatum]|uniref:Uncharacterized protein n=1 Tax=Diphasiastrum complanatum TaxID=34168 RepID=A0ACC2AFS7_DIPCM|nr:hypothetical protein O6H91_22G057400 [Diphasiastrum complanatum]